MAVFVEFAWTKTTWDGMRAVVRRGIGWSRVHKACWILPWGLVKHKGFRCNSGRMWRSRTWGQCSLLTSEELRLLLTIRTSVATFVWWVQYRSHVENISTHFARFLSKHWLGYDLSKKKNEIGGDCCAHFEVMHYDLSQKVFDLRPVTIFSLSFLNFQLSLKIIPSMFYSEVHESYQSSK